MTKLSSVNKPEDGKKGYSGAVSHERHHRIAMASLHDLIAFHQLLRKEIQAIEDGFAKGQSYDRDLYKKMTDASQRYKDVMNGFVHLNDDDQRHVMITFADTVKDLMAHIHHKRKH